MTTAQVKESEEIVNKMAKKNEPVYAKNAALAQAKAIQGLRAVFDEVKKSVSWLNHLLTRYSSTLLSGI